MNFFILKIKKRRKNIFLSFFFNKNSGKVEKTRLDNEVRQVYNIHIKIEKSFL